MSTVGGKHTHYQILGLENPRGPDSSCISEENLKVAYRRTLFLYHPDKACGNDTAEDSSQQSKDPRSGYTVDQIILAYQTLNNSRLRAAYDKELLDKVKRTPKGEVLNGTHLGVETFDLDDLDYDDYQEVWSKSCRCGLDKGYILKLIDLEKSSKDEEVYVGCTGCSLFIKVLFSAADDEEQSA